MPMVFQPTTRLALASLLGVLAFSARAQAQAVESADGERYAAPPTERRGGFHLGLASGAGYGGIVGYPNKLGQIDNRGRSDWSVEWTVLRDNVSTGWREAGVDLQQAIDSGVDGLADILASRYAHSSSGGELVQYIVAVEKVASLDDYAAVLIYLENQVFVEGVTPVNLESGQVYYRVTMRGALRELERSLALMPSLRPAAVAPENLPSLTGPFGSPNTEATEVQPSVRERVDLRYHFVVR